MADDSAPQWRKSSHPQEITATATSITATHLRQCSMIKTGRQKQFEKKPCCIRFPLSPQGIWEWPLPLSPEKRIQFTVADLGPNRKKSDHSTQWFPNALCIFKVPESYLVFHYFMGILALDGMQTEINSLLILQGNQYRDCYCFEARDSQACSSFIRPPLLYRWMQAQHTQPSLIPTDYSFPKCLLRSGQDEVFHPTVSQV